MTPEALKECKAVILAHCASTGATEELREWLVSQRIRELTYIAFPFGRANMGAQIRIERYREGELVDKRSSWWRWRLPEPLAYTRDLIYASACTLRFGFRADLLFAGDNLLTLAALIARPLARVKRVVYYMLDFSPQRFANPVMNRIYRCVDKLATEGADRVWALTSEMIEARFANGQARRNRTTWSIVPYGSHPYIHSTIQEWQPSHIVYMGDITRNKGAELFVPMARELQSLLPDFHLSIIGGGDGLEMLRQEVADAALSKHITIYGFVREFNKLLAILATGGVAIAPYYPHDKNSFTYYCDPGKVKVYLGCGIPVVLTAVPPIAHTLEQERAGIIAGYSAAEFATAIASVVRSPGYLAMRNNACRVGRENAWPVILPEAISNL